MTESTTEPGATSPATRLSEADLEFLVAQTTSLVEFAQRSPHPDGGFAWLDDDGHPLLDRPVELWISCRMIHVLALAEILGDASCRPLVAAGLEALRTRLHDEVYDGWYAAVTTGSDGASQPSDDTKAAYAHGFVVLATASAAAAGHDDARPLLDAALAVFDRYLWRDADGLAVDVCDRTFEHVDPYRGVNANMHTVEALLAAHDVTGDEIHLQRAMSIISHVVHDFARGEGYRLPEHYDEQWHPLLDYNRDQPRDRFRPYGVTIGHLMEWARLALHARTALRRTGTDASDVEDWLLEDARALFARGVEDGWQERTDEHAEGFVYTTDFEGRPVVEDRLHWVVDRGHRHRLDPGPRHGRGREPAGRPGLPSVVRPLGRARPRLLRRRDPRFLAPRARPAGPSVEPGVGGQAGRVPRLPGHAPAPARRGQQLRRRGPAPAARGGADRFLDASRHRVVSPTQQRPNSSVGRAFPW